MQKSYLRFKFHDHIASYRLKTKWKEFSRLVGEWDICASITYGFQFNDVLNKYEEVLKWDEAFCARTKMPLCMIGRSNWHPLYNPGVTNFFQIWWRMEIVQFSASRSQQIRWNTLVVILLNVWTEISLWLNVVMDKCSLQILLCALMLETCPNVILMNVPYGTMAKLMQVMPIRIDTQIGLG